MLNTSPLLAVQSLSKIYAVGYNGTATEFSLSSDITESLPEEEIVDDNVLSLSIVAVRCSSTSTTSQSTNDPISKGDIFYLCLKPDIGDVTLDNINLFALYDFNSTDDPSGQLTLVSRDAVALPGLVQIGQDGNSTRISFPILPVFVDGSSDKLTLEGSADSTFIQTNNTSVVANKGIGDERNRAGFKFEVTVVLDKEVGCFSKLLSRTMSLINSGL